MSFLIPVRESVFARGASEFTVGLANLHPVVSELAGNWEKILWAVRTFRDRGVNLAVFPEFGITGYFWDDPEKCRAYMDGATLDRLLGRIRKDISPLLDGPLTHVILNGLRSNPDPAGLPYFNTTLAVTSGFDSLTPANSYDKVFLPGIEQGYTESGRTNRLILPTPWGRLGFLTCYDLCFPCLSTGYALTHDVDVLVVTASWRSGPRRDYPGTGTGTDHYYGFLWDLLLPAAAATSQAWVIAANAVGAHEITADAFWGGSGVWAPSGIKLLQAANDREELLILRNLDIRGERASERADFDYRSDCRRLNLRE